MQKLCRTVRKKEMKRDTGETVIRVPGRAEEEGFFFRHAYGALEYPRNKRRSSRGKRTMGTDSGLFRFARVACVRQECVGTHLGEKRASARARARAEVSRPKRSRGHHRLFVDHAHVSSPHATLLQCESVATSEAVVAAAAMIAVQTRYA